MKLFFKLFLIATLTATTYFTQAQTAIDSYFADWKSDPNMSIVNVSPKMFELLQQSKSSSLDESAKSLVSSLNQLKTVESSGPSSRQLHQDALNKLRKGQFVDLMQLSEGGFNVDILSKGGSGNFVNELVLIKSNDSKFYMSDIIGENIDLSKVSQLGQLLNAPDMEHLKNIKK